MYFLNALKPKNPSIPVEIKVKIVPTHIILMIT